MQNPLPKFPNSEYLESYMQQLYKKKKSNLAAVVLYGSTAKGEFGPGSDIDLLIIIKEDTNRFIDRLLEYGRLSDSYVEPLVYTLNEIKHMLHDFHPLLLEILADGIPLFDDGTWKLMKKQFNQLLKSKEIKRKPNGWIINPIESA